MMPGMTITLTAAGVAAILNCWIAWRVVQLRRSRQVSVGDGGDQAVVCRMRAHANFTEFTPFVLILIAVIEYSTGTSLWLWAVMAIYMLGRIAHAYGMDGWALGRSAGAIITLLVLLGLGIYAIVLPYSAGTPRATPAMVTPTAQG